jgi:hypothetical protein
MRIEKYSFGTGDRFGKQGNAQLHAIMEMNRLGVPVVPVWNKSNREHAIIGSSPPDVSREATMAIEESRYSGSYYVDADHINFNTVDRFMECCNFFTIDVAHFIGKKPEREAVNDFIGRYDKFLGTLKIPGITEIFNVTRRFLHDLAENYLVAVDEVSRIYRHISSAKGKDNFITEVSVDEAELVQGPAELFFILALLKERDVEVQTIAPKFSGLFAKGVDYIGDVTRFAREFEQDVAVVQHAIKTLGLSGNLKLSVHSGSDKFSIYPAIRTAIRKYDAGIHIKTAGTTWLEEVAGLAESGPEGLEIATEIYARSLERFEELSAPYATVLHIDRNMLPDPGLVKSWTGKQYLETLNHDPACKNYNPHFRQLIHVGYKIAAEMGGQFLSSLKKNKETISKRVSQNLLEKHLRPLFMD